MTRYKLTKKGENQSRLYFAGNTHVVAEMSDEDVDAIFNNGGNVYFEKIDKTPPATPKPPKPD